MLRLSLFGLLLVSGCTDKTAEEDDGGGSLWIEDPTAVDPDAPLILSVDAWCYRHDLDESQAIWSAWVSATDPQGADTIESLFDGITVYDSTDSVLFTEPLTCADGQCTGSWREDSHAPDLMHCDAPEYYTLEFIVIDEEGFISAPHTITGRAGTDASG